MDLSASDLDSELFPDDAAENMERSMSAHHLITEIPVNGANDFAPHMGRRTVERMPDNTVALAHRHHSSLIDLVFPRNDTMICHLTTAAWIEYGSVQCYIIAFNGNDFCCTLVHVAVCMVKEL